MSEIIHTKGATILSGPDATELYRTMVLNTSLRLLQQGITPTRGLTRKKALAMVTKYTGVQYKGSEIDRARRDLNVWIETMKSAIPVRSE